MATKNRTQMITMVLETLGVKAASQSATPEDLVTAGDVLDSVHPRLRKEGLAPFTTSAVPEWAQVPLSNLVAVELLGPFGVGGERAAKIEIAAEKGRKDLAAYVSAGRQQAPVRPHWF